MPRRPTLALLAGLLLAGARAGAQPAPAVDQDPEYVPPTLVRPSMEQPTAQMPALLRWMVHPRIRGMFINLPILDTDPNRGLTVGVMPIWVVPAKDSDRVEQIHAPSLTYNKDFSVIPTYRYYYYPTTTSSFQLRGSMSVLAEREAFVYYQDRHLLGRDLDFSLRGQYNIDGSNRFYGLGPASAKKAESDYTEDVLQYDVSVGVPIVPDTRWMAHVSNHFAGEKFYGGKISALPDTVNEFPGIFAKHRQEVMEGRLIVGYDSRDTPITTTQGQFLQAFVGASAEDVASAFSYSRYGFDGREFYKWDSGQVTAAQVRFEQLLGDAPFWLLPRLGGKYSQRAYGDQRFIDRSMIAANIEHRVGLFEAKLAGVTTDFEVAPFVGLGTVADSPQRMAKRYARPVVGSAIRAVARPQVVGSVDFGVGQEGLTVFMDINYSF